MSKVIDLNVKGGSRTQIRINGDDSKIIELNLNDINILTRLNTSVKDLEGLKTDGITKSLDNSDRESVDRLSDELLTIDAEIRNIVNNIFDFDVCTPIAGNASMLDLIDGQCRFEVIIKSLSDLYKDTFEKAAQVAKEKVNNRVKKYTR